jgi:tight adherence protein C
LEFLSPSKRVERRVWQKIEQARPEKLRELTLTPKERPLVSPETVRFFQGIAKGVSPLQGFFSEGVLSAIDRMLIWAGRPNNLDAPAFMALWLLVGGMGLLVAIVSLAISGGNRLISLVGVVLAALMVAFPWYWLRQAVKRRQDAILSALPDKLDLLRVCVEAGMPIDAALNHLCGGEGPLDQEIKRLVVDLNLAKNLEEKKHAYWALSERCGLPEIEQVVQFLLHTQEVGQPPSETLEKLAELARFSRQNYVTQLIEVLPNKIVFPLACCFLPALLLVFVFPLFLRLLKSL